MSNNSTRGLLIAGAVLALLGTGYYFWTQKKKNQKILPKDKDNSDSPTGDKEKPKDQAAPPASPAAPAASPKKPAQRPPSALSADMVRQFQDWMDTNHPNWVSGKSLNKGAGYGTFGPSTKAAWAQYAAEFQNAKAASAPFAPNTLATAFENAVNYLASRGYNPAITRTLPQQMVIAWASAAMAGKARFLYAGEYYDTSRGIVSPDQTPDQSVGFPY